MAVAHHFTFKLPMSTMVAIYKFHKRVAKRIYYVDNGTLQGIGQGSEEMFVPAMSSV